MKKLEIIKKYKDALEQGYLVNIYRYSTNEEEESDGFSTLGESELPYCFGIDELDDDREYYLSVIQK